MTNLSFCKTLSHLAKPEKAPLWIPRRDAGYIVAVCTECLRSFPVADESTGTEVREAECPSCETANKYAAPGAAPEPWDRADWLFELKYDCFRSLAYISQGECRFVSRNDNRFASFQFVADALGHALRGHTAILDGELVYLDAGGRPVFNDSLYRRREPLFVAFDALWIDEEDRRYLPLVECKATLRDCGRYKRAALAQQPPRLKPCSACGIGIPPLSTSPCHAPLLRRTVLVPVARAANTVSAFGWDIMSTRRTLVVALHDALVAQPHASYALTVAMP